MRVSVFRVLLLLAGSVITHVAFAGQAIVIEGGTLIDIARPDLTGPATLVIEDGYIRAIGSSSELEWPADARVIDARGNFVLPGIADMHNHLRSGTFTSDSDQVRTLKDLLAWGVTTTFNPGVQAADYDALRAAIRANPASYPRALLIRGVFTSEGGWGNGYTPKTPAEARQIVLQLKAAGSDGVKLMYDDMRWATTRPFPIMERAVAAAIIDEAHRQGMLAFAHAPIQELAKQLLEDGIDCLLHGIISDPIDAEFIDLMKRNNACYISTMTMFETNAGYAEWAARLESFDIEKRVDRSAIAQLYKAPNGTPRLDNTAWTVERLPVLRLNLFTVNNAGIPLLIGTDTGIPGVLPGISTQLEMVMHVEAGLAPEDVLKAATASPAMVFGRAGQFGTLAPGAEADVLILTADPRIDIENIRRIRHVIRAGQIVR